MQGFCAVYTGFAPWLAGGDGLKIVAGPRRWVTPPAATSSLHTDSAHGPLSPAPGTAPSPGDKEGRRYADTADGA